MEFNLIYIFFSVLFGLVFGSFISMASWRLPREEGLFKDSFCPKCRKKIGMKSLIPVFSWAWQGGKCSNCNQKISIRYPLIEIVTALLFVISYMRFGDSLNTIIFDLILSVCLIMFVSDFETYLIPDSLQISLFILSLFFVLNNNYNMWACLVDAFIYYCLIMLVAFFVKKWKKKEVLGMGDVKFIMIVGFVLGIESANLFFLFSGFIGTIFGILWTRFKGSEYYPFGPALIASFLLLMII
ncbi:MAG: prepilin peptidase [Rickettsiales bacterium]|jgi:prepilin signal peptidase PulO-like enzyme (type II secretory pathway)|nr:prepilin peptidase [Rickettsiales bacterium]